MRWLVWSNLLIAGSAAGWVVVTLRALRRPLDAPLMLLAFSLTLAFYTRDRLHPSERLADRRTMPERAAWVERHAPRLRQSMYIAFSIALLMALLRPAVLPPLLAGLGFALTYTRRWLPWRGKRWGWKHLPAMKMPFVALLWTLTTVIAPAMACHAGGWPTGRVAGGVGALVMVQILLNDLRDVTGDRLSDTVSLPVLVGDRPARWLGGGLILLALLLTTPLFPFPFWVCGGYSAFLLWRYRRRHDARWRVWIEGQGVLAGLAALLSP
ncbi:MAG: hypothetical protein D6796_09360 [Caldilineae bacterium]|nr:MAG: hypothetical protein D6796_09360 [Caldilineae bacterium]